TARRDPDLVDGMPRWQVFVNNEPTPVGFLQGHRCPLNDGAPGLLVFGPGNRPVRVAKPGRDDGCFPPTATVWPRWRSRWTWTHPRRTASSPTAATSCCGVQGAADAAPMAAVREARRADDTYAMLLGGAA